MRTSPEHLDHIALEWRLAGQADSTAWRPGCRRRLCGPSRSRLPSACSGLRVGRRPCSALPGERLGRAAGRGRYQGPLADGPVRNIWLGFYVVEVVMMLKLLAKLVNSCFSGYTHGRILCIGAGSKRESANMIRFAIALLLLLPFSVVGATTAPTTYSAFEPGAVWLDTEGNSINCHGGGFLFQNGTYYWFGEHKVARRAGHIGVACYSSTDLFNWKNEGLALSAGADTGDLVDGCVIERPKVIFNSKTKKYVMWFHLELRGQGYGAARAAVAISDTPTGPYKYLESFRPDAGQWPINFSDNQKQPTTAPTGRQVGWLCPPRFCQGADVARHDAVPGR